MKFNKKVLPNGLTVIHEERDVPVTTVMLATKFGAIYETAKEKGIAHFMEHMAFKGTAKRSAFQIASEVEKVGGDLNAFTDEEETAYHVKLPSQHLEKAIEIISDIFFNPSYPVEEFSKEANVICEEIKMYEDDPRMHVLEGIKGCLYKDPFGMFIAGSEKTVRGLKREELLSKHKKLYSPKNSILCVVGKNSFKQVLELAERFSVKKELENISLPKIELQNLKVKKTKQDLQQANLAIGFHIPIELKHASDVFVSILGEGMSSKLFTEVREKRGLAYAVKMIHQVTKNFGYMVIYVGTERDKVEEVIKICLEEFKKMENISEKELEEGKQQVIGNFEVSMEDSSQVALDLVTKEVNGQAEDYYKYVEKIKKVSMKEIKKLAEIKDYSYYVLSPE